MTMTSTRTDAARPHAAGAMKPPACQRYENKSVPVAPTCGCSSSCSHILRLRATTAAAPNGARGTNTAKDSSAVHNACDAVFARLAAMDDLKSVVTRLAEKTWAAPSTQPLVVSAMQAMESELPELLRPFRTPPNSAAGARKSRRKKSSAAHLGVPPAVAAPPRRARPPRTVAQLNRRPVHPTRDHFLCVLNTELEAMGHHPWNSVHSHRHHIRMPDEIMMTRLVLYNVSTAYTEKDIARILRENQIGTMTSLRLMHSLDMTEFHPQAEMQGSPLYTYPPLWVELQWFASDRANHILSTLGSTQICWKLQFAVESREKGAWARRTDSFDLYFDRALFECLEEISEFMHPMAASCPNVWLTAHGAAV